MFSTATSIHASRPDAAGLIQYCVVEPRALLRGGIGLVALLRYKVLRLLTPILLRLVYWRGHVGPRSRANGRTGVAHRAHAHRDRVPVLAPARFRRVQDQAIWSLRLRFLPLVAISNGVRGRWSVVDAHVASADGPSAPGA